MADAVFKGATHPDAGPIEVQKTPTFEATAEDLLNADGLILGTPENFGYMSGQMKDFFDRTFYEVEGKISPLPYAVFIGAGNDGSGALTAIRRIAKGYPFIEVQEPVIVKGDLTEDDLQACNDLGLTLAVGVSAGIY